METATKITTLNSPNHRVSAKSSISFATLELTFQHGILGLQEHTQFSLSSFLPNNDQRLMLLQSSHENGLHYFVSPSTYYLNSKIEQADLDEACSLLHIAPEKLLMLFIVNPNERTMNIQAPVLIDLANQTASQYVFPNPSYDIKHPLF